MPETPNPSNENFLEGLNLVDNDVALAMDEIVRRLELNMPAKIEAYNIAKNLTGSNAVAIPKSYGIAPAVLTDKYINTILVSAAVSTVPGAPRTFKNENQIVIYSIDRKIESEPQVRSTWRRARVIRGIMYHFLTHCRDDQDRECWSVLEPTGVTMLPEQWEQYSGTACYYKMVQAALDSDN